MCVSSGSSGSVSGELSGASASSAAAAKAKFEDFKKWYVACMHACRYASMAYVDARMCVCRHACRQAKRSICMGLSAYTDYLMFRYELQTNTAAPVLYTAPPVSPPTTLPVSPTSPVSHPATPPLSHPMVVVPSPKPVSTAKPIVPAPTAPAQSPISVINKMILHPPTSVVCFRFHDLF